MTTNEEKRKCYLNFTNYAGITGDSVSVFGIMKTLS